MLQLSNKLLIFVPWFRKRLRHREELLSFDLSENLENSSDKGKSLKVASPAVAYILLTPCLGESAHIYTCRCELFFILIITGIPEPSD